MHGSAGTDGHDIVFIIGSPRSGTTWLQRLLATHPKVRTGQESFLFAGYVGPPLKHWHWEVARESDPATATDTGGLGLSCYFQEEEFLEILRDYMARLMRPMVAELGPGELFVDKTPKHALFVREIAEMLPASRFIHVVRDPRDVTASLVAGSRGWAASWAPSTSKEAIELWVDHVQAASQAARQLPPDRFCQIRYEAMMDAPNATLQQVASFLDLEWSPMAISQAINANTPETVKRGGGTPIPVSGEVANRVGRTARESPNRIGHPEPGTGRKSLTLSDKLVVWYLARRTMKGLGYSWSWRDWV
jgi:Sulfotransferase family